MATITIKPSQGTVDQEHAMAGELPLLGSDPAA